MKIKKIEYAKLDMPLLVPYTIAYETIDKAINILLKITTDSGLVGWGCAAPDLQVTGETPEDVIGHINSTVKEQLEGQYPFQIARHISALKNKLSRAPSTLAMVDMALFDLMARKAQLPLYSLLGGYKDSIQTSITIGITPLQQTHEEVSYYLKKGFTIIKLKGGLNLEEDIEKISVLREKFGNDFLLRFDANQGYSPEESIDFMNRIKKYNVEIFEQPTTRVNKKKLDELSEEENIQIMADESMQSLSDAYELTKDDVTDSFNIKLMKVGGITESRHITSVAKAAGMNVMVGCLDECSLGIAAGLHFALSSPSIEYADLDGHLSLQNDPFSELFHLKDGVLYPSGDDGLGRVGEKVIP